MILAIMKQLLNTLISYIITIPFMKKPFQDLRHPQKSYSMKNAMNLYINLDRHNQHYIGAWFLQPLKEEADDDQTGSASTDRKSALPRSEDEQYIPKTSTSSPRMPLVGKNETILLYLHGNAETRAQWHRRELYHIFQKMGYYVLAIDYRCYGDSSKLRNPTQTSMVEDGLAAFEWIESNSDPDANIFLWGHSLGTGVTSRLGQILSTKECRIKPKGYILEAPFNCMKDEVESFKASSILTFFGYKINNLLEQADMLFDNALWASQIEEPLMILHAKDDEIIPFNLAQNLFNQVKEKKESVEFTPFDSNLHLRHDGIFKAIEKNPAIINNFIQRALKST